MGLNLHELRVERKGQSSSYETELMVKTSEASRASLMAKTVKNLPEMHKTRVRPLDREDLREKGIATHSSILVRRIPQTEEPGGLQSTGSQRVRSD